MNGSLSAERRRKTILSVMLAFICILYILPVLAVVVNSFKLNTYVKTETFALPTAESFAGWANYIKGVTFGNYPFWKSAFYSLFITLVSTALPRSQSYVLLYHGLRRCTREKRSPLRERRTAFRAYGCYLCSRGDRGL